jgi:alkaline phosphatase
MSIQIIQGLFRPAGASALLAALILASFSTISQADAGYDSGAAQLKQIKQIKTPSRKAKGVILFVGDGMSMATITAARIFEGQQQGETGEENLLSFEEFPATALSKTYALNRQVPDSASTMTAMVTGTKTNFWTLSVDKSNTEEQCDTGWLKTILEMAEEEGLSTGVVSTARLTHATPGATFAHSANRGWEGNAENEKCPDIASQLIDFNYGDGLEVALGGGKSFFVPTDDGGKREDGRNLPSEWQTKNGSELVENTQGLLQASPDTKNLLGLFSDSHMDFELARDKSPEGQPSLAQMTEKALEILMKNKRGFFLMVEAGRIDHAHHGTSAKNALAETVELSNAVEIAKQVSGKKTLIIVTADHAHTMTMSGYPERGTDILGFAGKDKKGLPYTTLSYANGPGYKAPPSIEAPRADLTEVNTADDQYRQEATIDLSIETHGGEDVPIYASGPGSQWVRGVMEQHVIFHIMKAALLDYR